MDMTIPQVTKNIRWMRVVMFVLLMNTIILGLSVMLVVEVNTLQSQQLEALFEKLKKF